MFSPAHPYAAFLAQVQKPSRYTGGEYGECTKKNAEARICLAFPDAYEIGMSHLGTKILYALLNRHPAIACERVFAPWPDMEQALRERALPLLSLESARPLGAFDVVGFSLQYELNFTGVLGILDLGGIPLHSSQRDDMCPIVLAGGPLATHGEPLATFIDAFYIGEAEEKLPQLCLDIASMRREGLPRREMLIRLAAEYPLYVPSLYATLQDEITKLEIVGPPLDPRVPERVKRVWVKDLSRFPFPDDSPLPHAEAVFDRMAIEIARGCTEGCRFCQAGIIYRPVRERDPVAIVDALVQGIRKGGYEETSLTSLSTADYSCVTPLVREAMARLSDERVSLSVSSLRAYGLKENLLADLAKNGITGLTFSPEGGTQRMRDLVNKNVTLEDVLESAHRAFGNGHKRMKLYFMLGLPGETDEDVLGIVDTAAQVESIGKQYLRAAKVAVTVSTFVPKPHTPFQWARMNSREEIRRKHALLVEHARRLHVDVRPHENYRSQLEGIFARGDRRCARVLERAYRMGCRLDGWDEHFSGSRWEQAVADECAESGFDPARYLGELPLDACLPWSHLDMGVTPSFLANEYRKAQSVRTSPPCGKYAHKLLHPSDVTQAQAMQAKPLVCYHCGVKCDLTAMKEDRLFFLRRLNAWSAPQLPKIERKVVPATRRPQPQATLAKTETFFRYRLRYAKVGPAIFLSHLDLVRHLPRTFRRANLSIQYSSGFHPKPLFSFGPALGLGIPSLGEIVEVKLAEKIEPLELLARLSQMSPPGILFEDAVALGEGDCSLGRALEEAEYFAIPNPERELTSALALWHDGGRPLRLPRVERSESQRAHREQEVDLRESLRRVALAKADPARLHRLGWDKKSDQGIKFALRISTQGSARPREVVAALLNAPDPGSYHLVRWALWGKSPSEEGGESVDPLNLPRLRF